MAATNPNSAAASVVYDHTLDPGAFANEETYSGTLTARALNFGDDPVPPTPPAFNPLDPTSLAFYISIALTTIGFFFHKTFSNVLPEVGTIAVLVSGVAAGIVHAIKYHTFTVSLSNYNIVKQNVLLNRAGLQEKHEQEMARIAALAPAPKARRTRTPRTVTTPDGETKIDGRTKEGRAAKSRRP